MNGDLSREVWARLAGGQPLDDLGLPSTQGRTDLRGLVAPTGAGAKRYAVKGSLVGVGDVIWIQRGRWCALDLSGARLGELRFRDSVIDDCVFDGANCRGWRLWNTQVSNTSFRGTDLRGSAFGSIDEGIRNVFDKVDFSDADLRDTGGFSIDLRRCRFAKTILSGVDFGGAVFEDCMFEGPFRDVTFRRYALGRENKGDPSNEMRNVSFRGAQLAWVDFHGLDMDDVEWPDDGEHFRVEPYKDELQRLALTWEAASDQLSRRLAALARTYLDTVGPGRRTGVVSRSELIEVGGEEAVAEFRRQLQSRP